MDKIKILYLRDNPDIDESIKKSIDFMGDMDVDLNIKPLSFLETEEIEDEFFNIIIVKDFIGELDIAKRLKEKPKSIIRLIKGYNKNYYKFEFIGNNLFEELPEILVGKHPSMMAGFVQKNIKTIMQHYESNLKLQSIMRLMNDFVIICDLEGNIIESNGYIDDYTYDELVGRSIYDFIDEKTVNIVKEYLEKCIKGEPGYPFEIMVKEKNGNMAPVLANSYLVRNSFGEPQFFLSVMKDLKAQKEFWKKEKFYKLLVGTIRDAVIAVDIDQKIVLWNKGAEEMFGYSLDEVVGKDIDIILSKDSYKPNKEKFIKHILSEGSIDNLIVDCIDNQNRIFSVELNLNTLIDKDNNFLGIVGIMRNISNIQKNLDLVKKKNEEMEHLVSMVSHDLRAPLYSIENYLELLQDSIQQDLNDSQDNLDIFNRIKINLSNMETLIKDITDFSKAGLNSKNDSIVDLNELVEDIVNNIHWQSGRENFLIKYDKLPKIKINNRKIVQVFQNLLQNAYKFRKEGMSSKVEIIFEHNDKFIKFTIKDNGIGIDSKYQEKIFQIFYRTKEKLVEGTGAGLAITQKVINSYGGNIWVVSKPGEGANFEFTLPAILLVKNGVDFKENRFL